MNELVTSAEYAPEAEKYSAEILAVSAPLFIYSLTALQFEYSWLINAAGLLLWLPMLHGLRKKFPQTIKTLIQLSEGDKNSEAWKLQRNLIDEYHGPKKNLATIIAALTAIGFYVLVLLNVM